MRPVYAVILAGDNPDKRVREGKTIANKAFLPINGRPMLEYVVDCYLQSGLTGVAVVGPELQLRQLLGDKVLIIPQQGGMVANVEAAAQNLEGTLILSSCDIPLVTPESIKDFMSQCQGADLFYPLVPREDNERVFSGMKRTYVTLKEGVFTGGNIIVVDSRVVPTAAPPAGQFFAARKSPLKMAGLIGLGTLLKLVTKRLTIREIEIKMEKILMVRSKAVITNFPELGTDVDKESDYNIISAKLSMMSY